MRSFGLLPRCGLFQKHNYYIIPLCKKKKKKSIDLALYCKSGVIFIQFSCKIAMNLIFCTFFVDFRIRGKLKYCCEVG